MSHQIASINAYPSSGIKGILSDKAGYAIHPIIYQGQKYFIELEWRLIHNPVFREYTRRHNRRVNRGAPFHGRPGGVAACIYSYQERFNIRSGHKGEKLFETDLTKLTLGGEKRIRLYRIELNNLIIYLPEIMQIIFDRWEYIKQAPTEKAAESRAAASRLGMRMEPLDEAKLGRERMRAAVPIAEPWNGVVKEQADQKWEGEPLQKPSEELSKSNPPKPQTKFFFELFNECEREEDVVRLVDAFTRTYEPTFDSSFDPFWAKAVRALLTALCLQIFLWEGQSICKQSLEGYLDDLSHSDRTAQNARADKVFTNWKETWPDTALKHYTCFLMSPPKAQEQIIKFAKSLFVVETIAHREYIPN